MHIDLYDVKIIFTMSRLRGERCRDTSCNPNARTGSDAAMRSKDETLKAKDDGATPIITAICEALLVAAEAELAEKGVEGFTLRGCAKRAGVSHAAPAHHFKDANALLTALAADGFERFVEAMRKRQSRSDRPARQAHRRGPGLRRFRARQSGAVRADVRVVPAGFRPTAAEAVRLDGVQHAGRGRARDCAATIRGTTWQRCTT